MKKERTIKKIELLETGHLQVQYVTRIIENGQVIAETYDREVKHIDDDLKNENEQIKLFKDFSKSNLYPKKPIG